VYRARSRRFITMKEFSTDGGKRQFSGAAS
jgi:hypothetical protein